MGGQCDPAIGLPDGASAMRISRQALVLAIGSALLCCSSRESNSPDRKAAATGDRLPLRHLSYVDLESDSAGYRLMRNRPEWVAFWVRYWRGFHGSSAPVPPAPDFDFTREMLLGVGSGAHAGCGELDEIIINHVELK